MACALAIFGAGIQASSAIGQQQAAQDQKAALNRSAEAQSRGAAAQAEQARLAQKQADITNARQLRAALRQKRIAEASLLNLGANNGTQFSSGVEGGLASLGAQTNASISFINQSADINQQITGQQILQAGAISDSAVAQGQAADAQASSATYGAIGKLGGTIFDAGGGFKTIFGGNKGTLSGSAPG